MGYADAWKLSLIHIYPSWTPALKMAAGLIMSYGNMLSHGAVVAREYGIPVVVFNGDALRVFRNGDWLDIRGNTGRIRIVQLSLIHI